MQNNWENFLDYRQAKYIPAALYIQKYKSNSGK